MSTEKYAGYNNFLLPEKELSLKLVFDNVRNYVIVGAFVALARWFAIGHVTPVPGIIRNAPSGYTLQVLTWTAIVVGAGLFYLNVGQTFQIMRRLIAMMSSEEEPADDDQPRRPWFHEAGYYVSLVALFTVFLLILGLILLLAVYVVWFTASGNVR